jgi:AcrR family transcriptional regulator
LSPRQPPARRPQAVAAQLSAERLAHLLRVATAAFLEHGFHAASIDGIARAAGASKQTIYRHFRDKADLLRAVVRDQLRPAQAGLRDLAGDPRPPALVLAEAAGWMWDNFARPANLALYRLTVSLAAAMPDVTAELNRNRVSVAEAALGRYLLQLAPDAAPIAVNEAANRFGVLSIDGIHYLLCPLPAGGAERARLSQQAAELMLAGFLGSSRGPAAADAGAVPSPDAVPVQGRRFPPERAAALLEAAAEEFLRHGYEGSSVEAIAACVGSAKTTIYRHFGDKAGLFRVALADAARRLDPPAPPASPGPPEAVLAAIAAQVLDSFTAPASLALYRTAVAEAARFPDLARGLWDRAMAGPRGAVMAVLQGIDPAGRHMEAQDAARHFITMAVCGNRFLSGTPVPAAAERPGLAADAARRFLHGSWPATCAKLR